MSDKTLKSNVIPVPIKPASVCDLWIVLSFHLSRTLHNLVQGRQQLDRFTFYSASAWFPQGSVRCFQTPYTVLGHYLYVETERKCST